MITEEKLSSFRGTEHHFKGWLDIIYTDGVKYVIDNCGYWILSDISSVYFCEPKIKRNRADGNTFLVVDLKINRAEKTATLFIAEDKSETGYINLLYTQLYEWTDLTEKYDGEELNFYLIDGVLILRGEY